MEIELKLLLAPEDVPLLRAHPLLAPAPQLLAMYDIYVDTPDLQLCRHQAGLRVRQVDGRWVQTLKAGGQVSGGLHSRHEWESELASPAPDLDALDAAIGRKQPVRALLRQPEIRAGLQEVFTTRMERTVWQLHTPQGDHIECVLDQGVIESGERSVPVSEVELELKQGQEASLFDVALLLLREVPLQLGHMSKAERGYRLAAPQPRKASKAQPLSLDAAMTVEQVFQAIAANCLEQVGGNQDGVIQGADVESLHQMRVGLRRLRSALGMFKALLSLPAELQDALDWLTGALGEARDWDVLAGQTLAQLEGEAGPGPGPGALAQLTQAAQELAQEKHRLAAQAVASTRYTALVLGLQRWLHGCDWRSSRTPRQLQRLDAGVHGFAQRTLRADQRRLMKRGKRLLHATPQQRHRVRIAAKKTRYATEFFASLLHTRKVRPYVGRLSVLQDALGAMNDVRVADRLLQELPNGQADLQLQAAFIRGYLAARAQAGDGQRRMDKAWRRLVKTALPV
ncbi:MULTISPECIES: CYTH and CHAD domain-containing protein [unclassified Janthinobacterium]|uniref:CYTH and CHAD domain-containing protein n=1 Tax=unclassified Janthinobacterium TaxID=2610881 RepID=UPI00161A283B|nr:MULTISPECIES: CYTH and CHAD domain-containing protein [unclassified Janthinobacterium]MBB5609701.1 inorganic triphosphatase YgiF [Janthinobacterium sp. S3T4]MBB5614873.1 inorganic triphosphatase YgiF [Janthinobacterium sp. S3M3]